MSQHDVVDPALLGGDAPVRVREGGGGDLEHDQIEVRVAVDGGLEPVELADHLQAVARLLVHDAGEERVALPEHEAVAALFVAVNPDVHAPDLHAGLGVEQPGAHVGALPGRHVVGVLGARAQGEHQQRRGHRRGEAEEAMKAEVHALLRRGRDHLGAPSIKNRAGF